MKLQEQEFFAARDSNIAGAPTAARKTLIRELAERNPTLLFEFETAKRQADGESHLIRSSGRYPLCGRGDVNTYAIFAETDRNLLGERARLGVILPTGIATDATTQHFFKDLVVRRSLVSLYDFVTNGRIWGEIGHQRFKFCLLTVVGAAGVSDRADFAFFQLHPTDLARPGVRFELTPEEITLLNPNTGTCPVFRSRRDAEITLSMYRRVPVLIRHGHAASNPWGASFMRMMDTSNDSGLFRTRVELEAEGWELDGNVFCGGDRRMLPLCEAKMVHHFDHRWATYDESGAIRDVTLAEHTDPYFFAQPRYWVPESEVEATLGDRWKHDWFLVYRRICRATDVRTVIGVHMPRVATTDGSPNVFWRQRSSWLASAAWASFPLDYAARQRVGGTHLDYFHVEQLPIPSPGHFANPAMWITDSLADWIRHRVVELTYTAWDMEPFARDLGDGGPPFRWDEERRAVLRAELDGAFFHLYGIERDDADYILSTFPIVHRNDQARHGEHRTWRLVMEAFDSMAKAIASGEPFRSTLDPPPGHGPRHPAR